MIKFNLIYKPCVNVQTFGVLSPKGFSLGGYNRGEFFPQEGLQGLALEAYDRGFTSGGLCPGVYVWGLISGASALGGIISPGGS